MRAGTERRHRDAVRRALDHLRHQLDAPPGLPALAAAAGFSPFHFARLFRALTGESVAAHIRRLRLERAAGELGRGAPVTDAALGAGYQSIEAFSRAFRAAYGVPPSRFSGDPGLPAASGIHYGDVSGAPSRLPPAATEPVMDVAVVDLPPLRLAAIRLVGPYSGLDATFRRLGGWARGRPDIPGRARQVALTHDDPAAIPPHGLRSDACIEIAGGFAGDEIARPVRLVGGRYVRSRHRGPYDGLAAAWARLIRDWSAPAGHGLTDRPCIDHYLNDPDDVPPEALVTDLYLPLADGS